MRHILRLSPLSRLLLGAYTVTTLAIVAIVVALTVLSQH